MHTAQTDLLDRDFGDIRLSLDDEHVVTVTMCRPPDNFFDLELMTGLADAFDAVDREPVARAIVLESEGKHFCAGAKLSASEDDLIASAKGSTNPLYETAIRMAGSVTPIVAAVRGAAIGGGLGLALVADFRVASPESRFASNFSKLGMHHGFGISVTLPAVVGQQAALDLLYTGRRVTGTEAFALGLCDRFVANEEITDAAHSFAAEIAASAPLAVRSIKETMRGDLPARIASATLREHQQQRTLRATEDYQEGVRAYAERRPPQFQAR
jgi:2-(1,2-epoxy-1,2-dihydrophenyl)acetyl-CoA isomerase